MTDPRTQLAAELMSAFAERTGLRSGGPLRRYLWTDAFAVCNLLGLANATGEPRYRTLALELIRQVHLVLGRHREDDQRRGRLSGLRDSEAEAHPTRGGLRIGKPMPERTADQPLDDRLEWNRDGQYFHYLTKWMHALDQAARATGDARYNLWARELSEAAFGAFVYLPAAGGGPRMHWKMSIDLSRPLVPSMGQHDPLDGYVTCRQLLTTAHALPGQAPGPDLTNQTTAWQAILHRGRWATADPLGLGGLLMDAYRLYQLPADEPAADDGLRRQLLAAALAGLKDYAAGAEWKGPAQYRLGFRELGLAIGLQAAERMLRSPRTSEPSDLPRTLQRYLRLGPEIEAFWCEPAHRSARTWAEHQDINEVMLATCLAPDGFLVLAPPGSEPGAPG